MPYYYNLLFYLQRLGRDAEKIKNPDPSLSESLLFKHVLLSVAKVGNYFELTKFSIQNFSFRLIYVKKVWTVHHKSL